MIAFFELIMSGLLAVLFFIGLVGGCMLIFWLVSHRKKDDQSLTQSSELHAYKYSNGSGLRIGH